MSINKNRYADIRGVIHCHSLYSDGRGGVGEIMEAANRADLDFLILTDHNTLKAKENRLEGAHGKTYLLVGEEVTPVASGADWEIRPESKGKSRPGHMLAIGVDEVVDPTMSAREWIEDVHRQGGIALAAHPEHRGSPKPFDVKAYPWPYWDQSEEIDGFSLWDLHTDWLQRCSSVPAALYAYFQPAAVLKGPERKTLDRLDSLAQKRPVTVYGECDNHKVPHKFMGRILPLFEYERAFRLIATRLLVEAPWDPKAPDAGDKILEALKAGRVYVAQEWWWNASGFSFRILGAGAESAAVGEKISCRGKTLVAEINLPMFAHAKLLRNGVVVNEASGRRLYWGIRAPGAYRVEVYKRKRFRLRPWIFSAPIRLTD